MNTQTETNAVGIQNEGVESASNDGKQYASATVNGKSVLLATESAQNEKASANAEVKRSLSKTKVEKLKADIRKLGEKRITKDAGGKKITILTDDFTYEKNVFSKKGRKSGEVNERIKNIPNLQKLIENSEYVGVDTDIRIDNDAKKGVKAIHKFKTQVPGYDVEILVRDKGTKQYLYEVKFIENKKSSQQTYADKAAPSAAQADVENSDIVAQENTKVNPSEQKSSEKSTTKRDISEKTAAESESKAETEAKADDEAERARIKDAYVKAEKEAFDAIDDFFMLPASTRYNITRMYMDMANVKDVTKQTKKALASIMMAQPDLHIYTTDKLADNGAYWINDKGERCIIINKEKGAVTNTIIHEITHAVAQDKSSAYTKLSHFVLKNTSQDERRKVYDAYLMRHMADLGLIEADTTLDEAKEIFKALPKKQRQDFHALVSEEITARGVADALKSKDFLEKHGAEHKGFFLRAIAHLRDLASRLTNRSEADKQIREIEKMFSDAVFKNKEDAARFAKEVDAYLAEEKPSIKRSFVGKTEDGRSIYKTNYPANTPKDVKQKDIVDLVQNVWSKKPISLTLVRDGKKEKIKVLFDPELSERSDLSKIAFGNRKGTASDKRITLNLSSDLYQIAEESEHTGSKNETGKDIHTHDGVSNWHYFATDLVYIEEDGTEIECHMNIDVKEKGDGNFFYSFGIEKGSRPTDVLSAVTDESATTSDNSISDSSEKVNTQSKISRSIDIDSPSTNPLKTKKSTEEYLNDNIIDFTYLPRSVRDTVINRLHNVQNAIRTVKHAKTEARSLSEEIMNAMSANTRISDTSDIEQARELISYVRSYVQKIEFTESDKAEIKSKYDKEAKSFLSRWQYRSSKGSSVSPDTFIRDFARENAGFEFLEEMNYIDALFAINDYYVSSRRIVEERRVPIDDSANQTEWEHKRQSIENTIQYALLQITSIKKTREAKAAAEALRKESEVSLLGKQPNTAPNQINVTTTAEDFNVSDRIISTHDERSKWQKTKDFVNDVRSRNARENANAAMSWGQNASLDLQIFLTNDKAGIENQLVRVANLLNTEFSSHHSTFCNDCLMILTDSFNYKSDRESKNLLSRFLID